jgi:nicotinamidase-related amidase
MTTLDDGNQTFGGLSRTVHDMVAAATWLNYCGPKKAITSCSNQSIPDSFPRRLRLFFRYLETQSVILTGIAGNFCVLFTANDAYMRDFNLFVPSDCTVSNTKSENDSARGLMKKFLKADIRLSSRIALRAKRKPKSRGRSKPRKS